MNTHEAKMFYWNTYDLDFALNHLRCVNHFVEFQQILNYRWRLCSTQFCQLKWQLWSTMIHKPPQTPNASSELGMLLWIQDTLRLCCQPWTHQFVQAHACTVPCRTQILHLTSAKSEYPWTENCQHPMLQSQTLRALSSCFCRKSHFHLRSHHQHAHRALHGFFHFFEEQMHMDREHNLWIHVR